MWACVWGQDVVAVVAWDSLEFTALDLHRMSWVGRKVYVEGLGFRAHVSKLI